MPRVASADIPTTCTAGQLGKLIGVSERVVIGRKGDGRLPVSENGAIDLRALVQAGVKAMAAQQAASAKGEPVGGDLDSFRARESRLRGDKLQLLVDQLSAELIAADVIEDQVGAAFDAVRQKMLAIPAAYGPRLAVGMEPVEARELLTKGVHDALSDLSGGEILAAIKDRARRLASRLEDMDEAGEEAGPAT